LQLEASDVSDKKDYSLHLASSHALLIYKGDWWDRLSRDNGALPEGNEWIPRDFSLVAPIEHLLLEKWILEVAQTQLSQATGDAKSARKVRGSIGMVLDELAGSAPVQFGSLQELVDQGRVTFGISRHLKVLDEQLRWIEGAIGASEAEHRDRSSRRIGYLSLILTVALGVPAVNQIVEFLQAWEPLDPESYFGTARLVNGLTDIARDRPVFMTVVMCVLMTTTVLAIVTRPQLRRPPRAKRPDVYTAPGPPIEVVEKSEGDTPDKP
jgi:hypothetical protein